MVGKEAMTKIQGQEGAKYLLIDFRPERVNALKIGSEEELTYFIEASHIGVAVDGASFCLDVFGKVKGGYEFCIREMTPKGTYKFIRRIRLP